MSLVIYEPLLGCMTHHYEVLRVHDTGGVLGVFWSDTDVHHDHILVTFLLETYQILACSYCL